MKALGRFAAWISTVIGWVRGKHVASAGLPSFVAPGFSALPARGHRHGTRGQATANRIARWRVKREMEKRSRRINWGLL